MDADDFVLFPNGTNMYQEGKDITFEFPTHDDAIIFWEFMASFISGEITLRAYSK